jgi:hypothetical protein
MLSWGAWWQLKGSIGLLWTPSPKGSLPSTRVSQCLLRVVWRKRMSRLATMPCWELRATDDVEGECGEASDG